jgi:NAD(P)-dependent dehydrogenase (short-subunit alcohol dehydrogenase family)
MERRVAVVTGASKGLGRELAGRLVAAGWSVVIDARRSEELADAAESLRRLAAIDVQVVAVPGDVSDAEHRRQLVEAAGQLGPVGLVVNNASTLGVSPLPRLVAIDADVLRRVFDVNVVGPVGLIALLAPRLGPGTVLVNVTSDAATGAYEGWGGYGSSKAALDQISRVLAVEHPQWRVYAVDPGDMRTEMHQDAFPGEDISDRPEPGAAADAIMTLVESDRPSGRYQAMEVT